MKRILYSALITLAFFCHTQAHVSHPLNFDLSGFNEPQKKVIIEELERYGKAIAPLYESNEEEWKRKVNEAMRKVFDGFRVYKLAAGNEPLNEYIRQFEDSTHLKVYVICYVEDAFMNNIFQRLGRTALRNPKGQLHRTPL